MKNALLETDFQAAAARLGVSVPAVKAVATVESNGGGFLPDGRVKVQYEPHVMYRQLASNFDRARADKELVAHLDLVAKKAGSYQSLDKEDKDMNRAAQLIDRTSALESASWGAFQIMGYHWKTLQYTTLQGFINNQYTAAGQLETFVRFIQADPRLLRALRGKDWAAFSRIYNGPNYAANKYDTKLAAAFKQYGGA